MTKYCLSLTATVTVVIGILISFDLPRGKPESVAANTINLLNPSTSGSETASEEIGLHAVSHTLATFIEIRSQSEFCDVDPSGANESRGMPDLSNVVNQVSLKVRFEK